MDDKKQVSFILDANILNEFDAFCDGIGLSRTAVLTAFMKHCVDKGRLPFVPSVPNTKKSDDGVVLYNFEEPMYHILREIVSKYENRG